MGGRVRREALKDTASSVEGGRGGRREEEEEGCLVTSMLLGWVDGWGGCRERLRKTLQAVWRDKEKGGGVKRRREYLVTSVLLRWVDGWVGGCGEGL